MARIGFPARMQFVGRTNQKKANQPMKASNVGIVYPVVQGDPWNRSLCHQELCKSPSLSVNDRRLYEQEISVLQHQQAWDETFFNGFLTSSLAVLCLSHLVVWTDVFWSF